MATIRSELFNITKSENPKKITELFCENYKNEDVDLHGYVHSLLGGLFLLYQLDSEKVTLRVSRYEDADGFLKFSIGVSFLPKLNNSDKDSLTVLGDVSKKFLNDFIVVIVDKNLNFLFNDITVNNKQWRNEC